MQNKSMFRAVDDDIGSPYKIGPNIFDFYDVVTVCLTLLTQHGGHHDDCCVTSYGLHLSATPLLRAHIES